jgi:hypothetical protein
MFTEIIINSFTLLFIAVVLWISYWCILGKGKDLRILIALNFSLITIWIFISDVQLLIRFATFLFITVILLIYAFSRSIQLPTSIDRYLTIDVSIFVIIISCISIVMTIQGGLSIEADKSIIIAQTRDSSITRYIYYLFAANGFLIIHLICTAAAQQKWTTRQKIALILAIISTSIGLSKASFLPIILSIIFVYYNRIGFYRSSILVFIGFTLNIFIIRNLFPDIELSLVIELFLIRILNNVDALNYIEELGTDQILKYPHSSPFYLLWPFYQFTQDKFIVPGGWLHGTLYDDWRGFGPNPLFIGDLIISADYVGLLLAPIFGKLLRYAENSIYRVFFMMIIYTFLQDWYLACLYSALFTLIFLILKISFFAKLTMKRLLRS